MATEIERKYLVDGLPGGVDLGPGTRMRQGYVAGEDDVEVRVRIAAERAVLTVKAGAGRSRTEVEVAVPLADAEELWPHTEGRRLEKTRHRVDLGDGRISDVDVYHGPLEGLCTAEVEFDSEEAAAAFVPPPWFGRELTDEPGWTNGDLARRGRPG